MWELQRYNPEIGDLVVGRITEVMNFYLTPQVAPIDY